MSGEKLDQPNVRAPDAKKDHKDKKKRKNRLFRWFREMKSELKKVVWPTPKQVSNHTGIVLVIIVISSAAVWSIDQVGSQIVRALISLGN